MVSDPGVNARSPQRQRFSKTRIVGATLATTAALFAASCGAIGGGEDGGHDGLLAGDYTIAAEENLTNSIVVNGNIAPIRSVSITTPLQSEVERLAVQPGDRVAKDQFLVQMNTDALQRQLAKQEKQQASAQAEAMQGVEQAKSQLNAYDQAMANGSNPAVAQAQAQVDQAQAALDAALAAQGGARMIASPKIAAHVQKMAGDLSSRLPGGSGHGIRTAPPAAPAAPGQVPGGGQGAVPMLSVEQARAALQESQAALEAAKAQAGQERQQLQAQVDSAWRAAENASAADDDGTLQLQVQEATINAPMAGVVTNVDVQVGDIPQGRVLGIADDSRLLIRASVREADVPAIKQDNRVEFTSTATGKKKFTGRVTRVSPVGSTGASAGSGAEAAAAMSAGGSGGGSSVMFPVEIEVTGDKEGLLLGGSVRAEIITEEAKNSINIPRDAVYDENKVLVLATENPGDTSGVVEERTVKTGAKNDVDVAVTGGELKPGDIVINWPENFKDKVGSTVKVNDENFDPEQVKDAKDKKPTGSAAATTPATSSAATKSSAPAEKEG